MYYNVERNTAAMTSGAAIATRAEAERQVDNQSPMSSPTTPGSARRLARVTRHGGSPSANDAPAMAVQVVDRLRWWRVQRVREQPLPAHHYVLGANYTNYSAFGTRPLSSSAAHAVRRARALVALQRQGRTASTSSSSKHVHSTHVDPSVEQGIHTSQAEAALAEQQQRRCCEDEPCHVCESRTRSHSSPTLTTRQHSVHYDDMGSRANECLRCGGNVDYDEAGLVAGAAVNERQVHHGDNEGGGEEEEEGVMDNKANAATTESGVQTLERTDRLCTAHNDRTELGRKAAQMTFTMMSRTPHVPASRRVSEAVIAAAQRVLDLYRPRAASAPVSTRRRRLAASDNVSHDEQMGVDADPRVVVLHHPPRLVLYRKHCAMGEVPRVAGVTASDMANHELMKDQPEVFALGNLPLYEYERRFYSNQRMPWTLERSARPTSPRETPRLVNAQLPSGAINHNNQSNNPLGTRVALATGGTTLATRRSCATRVRGRLRAASLPALPPCSAALTTHTLAGGTISHPKPCLAAGKSQAACAHLFRQVEVLQDVYVFNPFVDCIGTGAFSQVYAALPVFHGRGCLPNAHHAIASHNNLNEGTTTPAAPVVHPVAIKVISRKAKKRPETAGNAAESAMQTRRQGRGTTPRTATERRAPVGARGSAARATAAVMMGEANVDNSQHRELVEVEREIAVLRRLHHSGCSTFYEALRTRDEFVIAMKLHPGSLNMRQYLARFGPPTEARAALMLYQLVETVNYLHNTFGLIHRDIKLENLLLSLVEAPLDLIQQTLGSEVGRSDGTRTSSAQGQRFATITSSSARDEKSEQQQHATLGNTAGAAAAMRTRAAFNGPTPATLISSPTGFAPALMQPRRRRSSSASSCASTTNMGTSVSTVNLMTSGTPYACALGTTPTSSAAKLLRMTLIDFGLARRTRFAPRATRSSHPTAGTMLSQLAQGQTSITAKTTTTTHPSPFVPRRADYANLQQQPSLLSSFTTTTLHATPTTLALLPNTNTRVLPIPTPLPSTANLFTDFYDVEDAEERLSGVSSTDVSASQTSQSSTADTDEEDDEEEDDDVMSAELREVEGKEDAERPSALRQGSYRAEGTTTEHTTNTELPQPWLVAAAGVGSSECEGLTCQLTAPETQTQGQSRSPQNISLPQQDTSTAEQPVQASSSHAANGNTAIVEGSTTSYGANSHACVVPTTPRQASSFVGALVEEEQVLSVTPTNSRAAMVSASKSAAREPSSSPSIVPMTLPQPATNTATSHTSAALPRSDSLASLTTANNMNTMTQQQADNANGNQDHTHSPGIATLAAPSSSEEAALAHESQQAEVTPCTAGLRSPAAEPHVTGYNATMAKSTPAAKEKSQSFSASVSFAATTGLPPAVPPAPLPPTTSLTTTPQLSVPRSYSYAAGTRLTRSAIPVREARHVTPVGANAASQAQQQQLHKQTMSEERLGSSINNTPRMPLQQAARTGSANNNIMNSAGNGHTNVTSFYNNNSYSDDEETTLLLTPCGTEKYMAPEMLGWIISHGWTRRPVTVALAKQLDSYAIGIVAYVLLSGCFPFNATTRATLAQQEKRLPRCNSVHWSRVSTQAIEFVQGLLHPDPHQRLTVKAALQHPFMQEARHWAEKLQLVPHAERTATTTASAGVAATTTTTSLPPNNINTITPNSNCSSSGTSMSAGSAPSQSNNAQTTLHERPASMSVAEHTLPVPVPELPRRSVSSLIQRTSETPTLTRTESHPHSTTTTRPTAGVVVLSAQSRSSQASRLTSVDHRNQNTSSVVLPAVNNSSTVTPQTSSTATVKGKPNAATPVTLPAVANAPAKAARKDAAVPLRTSAPERLRTRSDEDDLFDQLYNNIMSAE